MWLRNENHSSLTLPHQYTSIGKVLVEPLLYEDWSIPTKTLHNCDFISVYLNYPLRLWNKKFNTQLMSVKNVERVACYKTLKERKSGERKRQAIVINCKRLLDPLNTALPLLHCATSCRIHFNDPLVGTKNTTKTTTINNNEWRDFKMVTTPIKLQSIPFSGFPWWAAAGEEVSGWEKSEAGGGHKSVNWNCH